MSKDDGFPLWRMNPPRRKRPVELSLPASVCKYGYTDQEIKEVIGTARLDDFNKWMEGQTRMICAGEDCPEKHGNITYKHDVVRYLAGLPVID